MISNTKKWLSAYYKISEDAVETFFKNEDVTGFLIIWTIFEQRTEKRFFTYGTIKELTTSNYHGILGELKTELNYFHNVYKDKDRFRNLVYRKEGEGTVEKIEIKKIIDSPLDATSNEDKLRLLVYVVYRYRNNIFHGNKAVESWAKFKLEIGYCINIMKLILK